MMDGTDVHGRYYWEISFMAHMSLDKMPLSIRLYTDTVPDQLYLVLLAVKKLEKLGVSINRLSEPIVKQIDLAEHHG